MLYINPQAAPEFRGQTLSPGATAREKRALKEFEQLFLFQMLKEMRKMVPEDGLFGDGMKRAYFEEMLDDHLAGAMAESGQLGLARHMAAQLDAKPARPGLLSGDAGTEDDSRGIRLMPDAGTGGIRLKPDAGVPISNTPAGVPLEPDSVEGLPLKRAHKSYQAHQRAGREVS